MNPPHEIAYSGDPTIDFNLSSFLDRFSYKNPKQQAGAHRPRHLLSKPINNANFINSDPQSVQPDEAFFHKFFGARERLLVEGKSRIRSRKQKRVNGDDDEEDTVDGMELGDTFDERAIDEFADKLAMDMIKSSAGGNDDFDDFESDNEDDDDDDFVYGDGVTEEADDNDDDDDEGHEFDEADDSEEEGESSTSLYHDEDEAMDLADFVKSHKAKELDLVGKGKRTSNPSLDDKGRSKHATHEERRKKKKARSNPSSDFAPADEYEDEQDEIFYDVAKSMEVADGNATADVQDNNNKIKHKSKKAKKVKGK